MNTEEVKKIVGNKFFSATFLKKNNPLRNVYDSMKQRCYNEYGRKL